MATEFDALILAAIEARSVENPASLVEILGFVDGREKLVLSHEELAGGLERLARAGKITESSRHEYHGLPETHGPGRFSGLTPAEHASACDRYHRAFWQKYREGDRS